MTTTTQRQKRSEVRSKLIIAFFALALLIGAKAISTKPDKEQEEPNLTYLGY